MPPEPASTLLAIALEAAVPLHIADLRRRGGTQPRDLERARHASTLLSEQGDILLYRGQKRGQTAEIFNAVAFALAVMSYQPGGTTCAGSHWESTP